MRLFLLAYLPFLAFMMLIAIFYAFKDGSESDEVVGAFTAAFIPIFNIYASIFWFIIPFIKALFTWDWSHFK